MNAGTPDHHLDQTAALQAAMERLTDEFGERFETDEINRFLRTAYHEFAAEASMSDYLPLMAERLTRERLRERADAGD